MRLHIKECTCGRFAVRLDGERQWCTWRRGGYITDIKAAHEVLTHEQEHCESCRSRTITHIAETAGAVH